MTAPFAGPPITKTKGESGWPEKLAECEARHDALLNDILVAMDSQVDKRHGRTAHEAERRVRDAGKAVIDAARAQ